MKCMVGNCKEEIDELKSFPVTYGPHGASFDEAGQRAHAASLETWSFIEIKGRAGHADTSLASGHICPGHKGQTFCLALVKEGK